MNESRGCLNGLIGGIALWVCLVLIWRLLAS